MPKFEEKQQFFRKYFTSYWLKRLNDDEILNSSLVKENDVKLFDLNSETRLLKVSYTGSLRIFKISNGQINEITEELQGKPIIKPAVIASEIDTLQTVNYQDIIQESDLPSEINNEISDAVGELTNMISGQARKELAEMDKVFEGTIPTVITGKNHKLETKTTGPKVAIPFTTDFGSFTIEVCLEKKSA